MRHRVQALRNVLHGLDLGVVEERQSAKGFVVLSVPAWRHFFTARPVRQERHISTSLYHYGSTADLHSKTSTSLKIIVLNAVFVKANDVILVDEPQQIEAEYDFY